jgi:serine/threonine protein phosphatase PrpC
MFEAPFLFDTGTASHTGCVRDHNEDSFMTRPASGVWLVADGMGGHAAGDFASKAIADTTAQVGTPVSARDLQARFMDRLHLAHHAIRRRSAELQGATVGATLATLLIYGRHYACIWSGDSRVYLLRRGDYAQLTTDHTEVQDLLRAGAITPAQARDWPRRNVITRAIGVSDAPQTDLVAGDLVPGDTFLLCSDGLTEHVDEAEMAQVLRRGSAQECCNRLVALTLDRGARDNVTVVIVRCQDRSPRPGASDTQARTIPGHPMTAGLTPAAAPAPPQRTVPTISAAELPDDDR